MWRKKCKFAVKIFKRGFALLISIKTSVEYVHLVFHSTDNLFFWILGLTYSYIYVQLFSEMEDKNRKNLGELRDLGKMLALTFGPHLHRVREPLVTLHMWV